MNYWATQSLADKKLAMNTFAWWHEKSGEKEYYEVQFQNLMNKTWGMQEKFNFVAMNLCLEKGD